jgi:hypothetical protein
MKHSGACMLYHDTQWKKSKQSKRAYGKQEGLSYYFSLSVEFPPYP